MAIENCMTPVSDAVAEVRLCQLIAPFDVTSRAAAALPKRSSVRMSERGFTLWELLATVAIFTTVAGLGAALLTPAITAARADAEIKRVIGVLQVARETAITRQRDIELSIDEDAGIIRLVRIEGGEEEPFLEIALEHGVRVLRFDDMGGTPDGLGGEGAVDFGGSARLLFISDGSLVGPDDLPVNGAMYFAIAATRQSARAITITGTTARARHFRWNNGEWIAP